MNLISATAEKHKTAGFVNDDRLISTSNINEQVGVIGELEIGQLKPGKYQPRTHMDEAALNKLAASIKTQQNVRPILVRELTVGNYEIIAGYRSWRASQLAGLLRIPVLVRTVADSDALKTALIENIQREDLNHVEEAECIQRLKDECQMSHHMAAAAIGRSSAATSNILELLKLTEPVKAMMMDGSLEIGNARALLRLEGADQIAEAKRTVEHGLSVRVTELNVQHRLIIV